MHQPARNTGEQQLTSQGGFNLDKRILEQAEPTVNTDHATENHGVPGSSPGPATQSWIVTRSHLIMPARPCRKLHVQIDLTSKGEKCSS